MRGEQKRSSILKLSVAIKGTLHSRFFKSKMQYNLNRGIINLGKRKLGLEHEGSGLDALIVTTWPQLFIVPITLSGG